MQQIKLHLKSSNNDNGMEMRYGEEEEEEKEELLSNCIELQTMTSNENKRIILNDEEITLSLDDSKTNIIINSINKSSNNLMNDHEKKDLCLYYKYRSEYLMDHRQIRNNIIFIPIYILFIIFLIFTVLLFNNISNTKPIPYINKNLINSPFLYNMSSSDELEFLKECNISFESMYGYFDGTSFSFDNNDMKWFDYSIYKNDINSSYILNSENIKLGLFMDSNDSFYIYGDKTISINIPSSLYLNKNNYTIISIAKYNGYDKDIIFSSKHNNEWIFGFKNASNNIIYNNGIEMILNSSFITNFFFT